MNLVALVCILLQLIITAVSMQAASAYHLANGNPLLGQMARDSDTVAFNTSNNKFHALTCTWAERCTVHCINITRREAHKRGGIPCKVCGGGE
jgi:hypothetical protein